MSGPLTGIGQQQIPLSQPYQPGGNEQNKVARQQEQQPERGEIQVRGAPAGNAQESESGNDNYYVAQNDQSFSAASGGSEDSPRGSLVDIKV